MTVDTARMWDVGDVAQHLAVATKDANQLKIHVGGRGSAGLIAAYAGKFDGSIARVTIADPPLTHMDPDAPQFLNILRVCDVPDVLGMLAPRPLTIIAKQDARLERVAAIYRAADAETKFEHKPLQP